MRFFLSFTPTAKSNLKELKGSVHLEKRFKAVSKALKFLQENPRHPNLQTHDFSSFKGPGGGRKFLKLMPSRIHLLPIEYFSFTAGREEKLLLWQLHLIRRRISGEIRDSPAGWVKIKGGYVGKR